MIFDPSHLTFEFSILTLDHFPLILQIRTLTLTGVLQILILDHFSLIFHIWIFIFNHRLLIWKNLNRWMHDGKNVNNNNNNNKFIVTSTVLYNDIESTIVLGALLTWMSCLRANNYQLQFIIVFLSPIPYNNQLIVSFEESIP